jgi:hypothetical protein
LRLLQKLRQLGDIGCDPLRLVFAEQVAAEMQQITARKLFGNLNFV